MKYSIPVLIQRQHNKSYLGTPLLFYGPSFIENTEERLLDKLQRNLEIYLNNFVNDDTTSNQMERVLYSPNYTLNSIELSFNINTFSKNIILPFVFWSSCNIDFIFTPLLKDFLFMYPHGMEKKKMAEKALKTWGRKKSHEISKKELSDFLDLYSSEKKKSKYYHTEIVVNFNNALKIQQEIKNKSKNLFIEGRDAIKAIGRPIHFSTYSHQFVCTQSASIQLFEKQLYELLMLPERRAVMVVGPYFSGRTRAIESVLKHIDCVCNYKKYGMVFIEKDKKVVKRAWSITPGGFIAGMSQAGEWEHRCASIFEFADLSDSILCFDRLLGFLETGKTQNGNLTVADALQTALRMNRFRVVCEVTIEQLRLLREKKPALVEQFEILPMPILSEKECYEVCMRYIQMNTLKKQTWFDPEVLPLLFRITEHYESEKALPGRVCRWLNYMIESESTFFNVNNTLSFMQKNTGFDLSFFAQTKPLLSEEEKKKTKRERILAKLSEGIVGQREAIEAMADACLLYETFLNDPTRPAASLLFIGPTGVGKTESAKQLAKYLFGNEENLIRFDTNELTTPWAVAALIGDCRREGILTSAIRLKPNSVLLFDEIEKADPSLTDLLLQVLGEGRLTDGAGRLVSFTQCIIILTSNLGSSEAGHFAGFGDSEIHDKATYLKAVRNFFRPEWLNRLDRIVPFHRLNQKELEIITNKLLDQLKTREGLLRRKTLIHLQPSVMEYLVHCIEDPKWGARGTKRLLEKNLVSPAGNFFASTNITTASILQIEYHDDQLKFKAFPLLPKPEQKLIVGYNKLDKKIQTEINIKIIDTAINFIQSCHNQFEDILKKYYSDKMEPAQLQQCLYSFYEYGIYIKGILTETFQDSIYDREKGSSFRDTPINQILKNRIVNKVNKYFSHNDILDDGDNLKPYRIHLTMGEWDNWCSDEYSISLSDIGKQEENLWNKHLSLPDIFDHLLPYFILFGKIKPEINSVLILSYNLDQQLYTDKEKEVLSMSEEDIMYILNYPDWYPSMTGEMGVFTTEKKDPVLWFCITGMLVQQWANLLNGSNINLEENQLNTSSCKVVLPIDLSRETVVEVIQRWQKTEDGKWGPVIGINGRNSNNIPLEICPDNIMNILCQYLGEENIQ